MSHFARTYSETSSALSDRGIYVTDSQRSVVSSYDVNCPGWGASAEDGWCPIGSSPYMSGAFIWTGFDYKGEPTPYEWPNVNSHFGVIDIAGFPKDLYYYYQSVWSNKPMVHILPHWNWDQEDAEIGCTGHCHVRRFRGGLEIEVWTYTNGDAVELFLNGDSIGRQDVPQEPGSDYKCRHNVWKVLYVPGTLEAKAYKNGQEVVWATDVVKTTGEASAFDIVVDWPKAPIALQANGQDVLLLDIRLTDKKGNVVPVHDPTIATFVLNGPGKILGVGNGDPSSHEADTFPSTPTKAQRSIFNGHARVIVQTTNEEGDIMLQVTPSSPGLRSKSILIPVQATTATSRRTRHASMIVVE